MATNMTSKVLVDGRNLYQLQKLQAKGWSDYSVGLTAIDPGWANYGGNFRDF